MRCIIITPLVITTFFTPGPFQIATAADLQQVREAFRDTDMLRVDTPATTEFKVGGCSY